MRGRILIVDDDVEVRTALSRVLARAHDVVLAASGDEGLNIVKDQGPFDVILLDLMMPKRSGMSVHAQLASSMPEMAARVVFLSGGACTPEGSEYLARVGNLQVAKPCRRQMLMELVEKLVERVRAPE